MFRKTRHIDIADWLKQNNLLGIKTVVSDLSLDNADAFVITKHSELMNLAQDILGLSDWKGAEQAGQLYNKPLIGQIAKKMQYGDLVQRNQTARDLFSQQIELINKLINDIKYPYPVSHIYKASLSHLSSLIEKEINFRKGSSEIRTELKHPYFLDGRKLIATVSNIGNEPCFNMSVSGKITSNGIQITGAGFITHLEQNENQEFCIEAPGFSGVVDIICDKIYQTTAMVLKK